VRRAGLPVTSDGMNVETSHAATLPIGVRPSGHDLATIRAASGGSRQR
jgi:hypothetical protein